MAKTSRSPATKGKTSSLSRDTSPKMISVSTRAMVEKAEAARRDMLLKPARRPYGSEEGRIERQERFLRSVYGGRNMGEERKPAAGRLANLRKAFNFLAQSLNRDHNEFSQSQGAALMDEVNSLVEEFRQLVEANAKANQSRLLR